MLKDARDTLPKGEDVGLAKEWYRALKNMFATEHVKAGFRV
eukprot:COSAG01_NODE_39610_length_474_cov_1.181333_1_plen_41_part_00